MLWKISNFFFLFFFLIIIIKSGVLLTYCVYINTYIHTYKIYVCIYTYTTHDFSSSTSSPIFVFLFLYVFIGKTSVGSLSRGRIKEIVLHNNNWNYFACFFFLYNCLFFCTFVFVFHLREHYIYIYIYIYLYTSGIRRIIFSN